MREYVKSLLDEKRFFLRWFRQRACERQGIPFEDNVPQLDQPQPQVTPTNNPTTKSKLPLILGAGLLSAIGGSGLGWWLAQPQDQPQEPQQESLLQWLEDRGEHLGDE